MLNDFSLIMILYERLEYIQGSHLTVQHFLSFKVFIVAIFPMYFDYQHVISSYNILCHREQTGNKTEVTCSIEKELVNFPQIH